MRRSKFRAVRTGKYHSKKEARRAEELAMLERIGEIKDLREQVKYELIPSQEGERPVRYFADFVYKLPDGTEITEDVKGKRTPEYVIKRKLLLHKFGIRILET